MGAEFSAALLYYNIGGNETVEVTSKSGGNQPNTATAYDTVKYTAIKITKVMASFNISFYM